MKYEQWPVQVAMVQEAWPYGIMIGLAYLCKEFLLLLLVALLLFFYLLETVEVLV